MGVALNLLFNIIIMHGKKNFMAMDKELLEGCPMHSPEARMNLL